MNRRPPPKGFKTNQVHSMEITERPRMSLAVDAPIAEEPEGENGEAPKRRPFIPMGAGGMPRFDPTQVQLRGANDPRPTKPRSESSPSKPTEPEPDTEDNPSPKKGKDGKKSKEDKQREKEEKARLKAEKKEQAKKAKEAKKQEKDRLKAEKGAKKTPTATPEKDKK